MGFYYPFSHVTLLPPAKVYWCLVLFTTVSLCYNYTMFNICSTWLYILGKAPLQVLYDKIQHKGWNPVANTAWGEAECCICHKTPPRVLYFIIQHEYMVLLLICWFCVGELITSALNLGLGEWIHKDAKQTNWTSC